MSAQCSTWRGRLDQGKLANGLVKSPGRQLHPIVGIAAKLLIKSPVDAIQRVTRTRFIDVANRERPQGSCPFEQYPFLHEGQLTGPHFQGGYKDLDFKFHE